MDPKEMKSALKYGFSAPVTDGGIDLWTEDEPREFRLGDRRYCYRAWSGETIDSRFIAVDTETTFHGTDEDVERPPRCVLLQASGHDAGDNFIVHPDHVARFVELHADCHVAFFNIAFDVPVMERALEDRSEREAVRTLRDMVDEGRCHDAMLLDQLVRIAEGDYPYHRRSLARVADDLLGIEMEKDDSPRQFYETVLRKGYSDIDPAFYEYAARDARVTLQVFQELWSRAWELHNRHVQPDETEADYE